MRIQDAYRISGIIISILDREGIVQELTDSELEELENIIATEIKEVEL